MAEPGIVILLSVYGEAPFLREFLASLKEQSCRNFRLRYRFDDDGKDAEYREIFRSYAEALYGKGNKAEHLLDQIVGRKQNVRATFETFYSELLTQRNGSATTFQFIDNLAGAAAQPLKATAMSSKVLSGMSLPSV